MKKLLQVSAVLLAAVLMFAGCKNNADEGGDDLPGTWVSSLEYYDALQSNNWTRTANKVQYNCSNISALGLDEGYSTTYAVGLAEEPQLYGVRVKIKQNTFTEAEPGIVLFRTSAKDSAGNNYWDTYYQLVFWDGSYILYEKLTGQTRTCLSTRTDGSKTVCNTYHDAIKAEGNTNEVLFYTDGDKLVLKINGSTIKTIDKKLDTGDMGACIEIPSNATAPINANWEFLEFQTAK